MYAESREKICSTFELIESEVRYYCRQMPAIFTRAVNSRVWDEDGREYIDFLSACGSQSRGIWLGEAGGPEEFGDTDEPLARFGEGLDLLDLRGECSEEGAVRVTARWRIEGQLRADATVFAHLLDSSGLAISQADGYPLAGLLPFWLWETGEVMRDHRLFAPAEPGEYVVRLGVWELATGEHWPAEGWPEDVVLLSVSCR